MNAAEKDDAAALRLYDEGCKHREGGDLMGAEQSFAGALELKHDFGEAHLALGDVLAGLGRIEDAIDCYQLAVHFSPRLVDAHVSLASVLLRLKRHDEAEAACREALAINGESSRAWFWLGNVLKARGDLEHSVDAYRVAAAGEPAEINALQQLAFVEFRLGRYGDAYRDFGVLLRLAGTSPNAHHNFGLLQLETGYPEAALASFRRALELNPGAPETMTCVAHALRDLGRLDEAIDAYDEVLAQHPDFGDALGNRGQALLMGGNYAAGWKQYEQRFVATGTRARSTGAAPWQGESLVGKTIAVMSEQGVGDEIMFASCLPDLMKNAKQVAVECDPRLVTTFLRSFPGASVRARSAAGATRTSAVPKADFEISIGSLPLHFRSGQPQFPQTSGYLRADPARVTEWRARYSGFGKTRRVGIAWRGGTLRNRQCLRSLELSDLGVMLRQTACGFFSLQYGDREAELQQVCAKLGVSVQDVGGAVGADIDALAAAIEALDLVITVDNTVAHLSGALGKPTWVLVPFSPDWRYGRKGDTTAWYPSMRLFRQAAPRQWGPVVERVVQLLAADR